MLSSCLAGDCEAVLRPVNGVYMMDTDGNWQGDVDFTFAKAIYSLDFNNFLGSKEDFSYLLQDGYDEIEAIGAFSTSQSLAINLLFWMVFSATANWKGMYQQIQLTGSPTMVFDRRYMKAALSNVNGVCEAMSTTTFDKQNGLLTTVFDISEYIASPTCMDISNPAHLGYIPHFDNEKFRLNIDVRTLVTGAAVNMGILSPYELEIIPHTSSSAKVHGVTYEIDAFYNPRYPGMDPLLCQRDKVQEKYGNATFVCVIRLGATYLYPTFNHVGSNVSRPSYCECGDMSDWELFKCNEFNFVPSLIFFQFNESYQNESEHDLVHFSILNGVSGVENNRHAYNAAFDAVIKTDIRNDLAWRESIYEFCSKNTTRGCSMFTFMLADFGHAVSHYYYQVVRGACNNTFTIQDDAIEKAKNNPPVSTEERYYECRSSKIGALYEAFGIAVGNLLLTRFAMLLLYLCLITLFRSLSKKAAFPETYTISERMKILNFFAFQLLLARDGKYPPEKDLATDSIEQNDDTPKQSVLSQLHTELASIKRTGRFFPIVKSSTKMQEDSFPRDDSDCGSNPIVSTRINSAGFGVSADGVESARLSRFNKQLAAHRKWAEAKMCTEELDNPLDPQKSMKLL